MTLEEYKNQEFKNAEEPMYIKDVWSQLSRRKRREIERLVKKGKNPDIEEYLYSDLYEL